MVQDNRKEVSLYEEAQATFSSLIQQTASVFVGFFVMLLVTGGAPSSFVLALSFCLGTAFVAWSEQRRIKKSRVVFTVNTADKEYLKAALSPDLNAQNCLNILVDIKNNLELTPQLINQCISLLDDMYELLVLSDNVNNPSFQKLIQQVEQTQDILEKKLERITVEYNAINREIDEVRKSLEDKISNARLKYIEYQVNEFHKTQTYQEVDEVRKRISNAQRGLENVKTSLSEHDLKYIEHQLNEIQRQALELFA